MKLTALEIKQQKFEKAFRGYDPSEVKGFLNVISNEWEHMVSRNRELEAKVERLEEKVRHFEKVEEALQETLQTARDSAEKKIEDAKRNAENRIEKSEMQAEAIIRDATQRRQQVRQSILRLLDRRNEIISSIRSYLERAHDSLEQFSEDEAELFKIPELEEEGGLKAHGDAPGKKPTGNNKQHTTSGGTSGEGKTKKEEPGKESPSDPPGAENMDDIIDELD